MSKEQTPITAEGYLKGQGIERCTAYCSDIKDRSIDETQKTLYIDKLCDLMEQYAQAKIEEYKRINMQEIKDTVRYRHYLHSLFWLVIGVAAFYWLLSLYQPPERNWIEEPSDELMDFK